MPEQLVRGRGYISFGYEFAIQTENGRTLRDDVVEYHVRVLSNPDALRGRLGLYRASDTTTAQHEQRGTRPLTMPVLAIGGATSRGDWFGDNACCRRS